MANLDNKHLTAGETVTPRLKTEAPVSCPTEALFLQPRKPLGLRYPREILWRPRG